MSLTERHHFTPGNQLLVVQNVMIDDAGRYTCEMSNPLGTERAHSQLSILPTPGCRKDGTTVGIFTIAVVCSIVLTSLVWVCIIYQTRKKSEEYSVTNTGQQHSGLGGLGADGVTLPQSEVNDAGLGACLEPERSLEHLGIWTLPVELGLWSMSSPPPNSKLALKDITENCNTLTCKDSLVSAVSGLFGSSEALGPRLL